MIWAVYRVVPDRRSSTGTMLRCIGWVMAHDKERALVVARDKFGDHPSLCVQQLEGDYGYF